MAANIEKMKDAFMTGDRLKANLIKWYLVNRIGISEADFWNYIGYYVISVPPEKYEEALLKVKKWASEFDIGFYWIDYYNVRRSPIASCDIGYGFLPEKLFPGEKENDLSGRRLWDDFDDRIPKDILEYLNALKNFLQVEKIFRKYNYADNAMIITPLNLDYEEKSKMLREFVEKYGSGPFEKIHPLTFTGELIKTPLLVKKKN